MKTTEFHVDIAIVGFLACTWIFTFIASFMIELCSLRTIITNLSTFDIVLLLFIIYVVGILFDFLNSAVFKLFKSSKEKQLYKDFSIIKVIHKNDKLYSIIEIYYGRLRIARSLICSIPLITWSVCSYVYFNVSSLKVGLSWTLLIIIIVCVILLGLSIYSYRVRNEEYKKYIKEIKEIYILE